MKISRTKNNNYPAFGYQIKKTELMQNVFKHNKSLLKKGQVEEVTMFCEAISNIYDKIPKKSIFSCEGSIENSPYAYNNQLQLRVLTNYDHRNSIIVSSSELSTGRHRDIMKSYADANEKLEQLATKKVITEGVDYKEGLLCFKNKCLERLFNKWKNSTTTEEKDAVVLTLSKKLKSLESKMI